MTDRDLCRWLPLLPRQEGPRGILAQPTELEEPVHTQGMRLFSKRIGWQLNWLTNRSMRVPLQTRYIHHP